MIQDCFNLITNLSSKSWIYKHIKYFKNNFAIYSNFDLDKFISIKDIFGLYQSKKLIYYDNFRLFFWITLPLVYGWHDRGEGGDTTCKPKISVSLE